MKNQKNELPVDYKLVSKTKGGALNAEYLIEHGNNLNIVYLTKYNGERIPRLMLGTTVTETKRGWTFHEFDLTGKPLKIFLDRQLWEKVYL